MGECIYSSSVFFLVLCEIMVIDGDVIFVVLPVAFGTKLTPGILVEVLLSLSISRSGGWGQNWASSGPWADV